MKESVIEETPVTQEPDSSQEEPAETRESSCVSVLEQLTRQIFAVLERLETSEREKETLKQELEEKKQEKQALPIFSVKTQTGRGMSSALSEVFRRR
jgi:predicted RNase H-like nuclease (RuvC/YqgF family)